MRYYPKLNQFKISNATVCAKTLNAFSYGWWRFIEVRGETIVFNNYRYSTTTSRHQDKAAWLLRCIYLIKDSDKTWHDGLSSQALMTIEAPNGLQAGIEGIREHYAWKIKELEKAIAAPRTHKKKNEERQKEIERLKTVLEQAEKVFAVPVGPNDSFKRRLSDAVDAYYGDQRLTEQQKAERKEREKQRNIVDNKRLYGTSNVIDLFTGNKIA